MKASDFINELLDAYSDASTPESAVRLAARDRLKSAREYGLNGPPFDPHVLASLLDIRTRPDELLPGIDAMIVPDADGTLTIIWNDRLPKKRTNFSVAHEIGHTLFPSCAQMVQYRQRITNPEDLIEVLCDIAAAEFLMPLEEFTRDVAEYGQSMETVLRLSARYQASPEAIAIRMQFCSDEPLAMLVARRDLGAGDDSRDGSPRFQVNVQYAFENPAFAAALPSVKLRQARVTVPRASCVHRALWRPLRSPLRCPFEAWPDFDGQSFAVEAMSLPSAPGVAPRVLALLRPADPSQRESAPGGHGAARRQNPHE